MAGDDTKTRAQLQEELASLKIELDRLRESARSVGTPPVEPFPAPGAETRVLVVDESPVVCETISQDLARAGYQVTTTLSGVKALELLERNFDAVLLHLELPDLHGILVLTRIKQQAPDLPVIMLTASADLDSRIECFAAGADDYLIKPYHLVEMLTRLDRLVRVRRSHLALRAETETREQAQHELRESEEKFRTLVSNLNVGIFIAGTDNRYLFVNETAAAMVGCTVEEFLRLRPSDLYADPQDQERLRGAILGQGSVRDYHILSHHRNGGAFWVSLTAALKRDAAGNPVQIIGAIEDITQRKRLEILDQARLRISSFYRLDTVNEILRATLDEIEALTGSQAGFYHFFDAAGKYLTLQEWSTNTVRQWCKAEGKGSHYPIDQAGVWVDCVREKRPVVHNDYAGLPHKKGLPPGHVPVVRELTVPVIREDRVVAVLGVGNKPTAYDEYDVEVAALLANRSWDIVARKLADEARKASEEKLRLIVENSGAMVAVTNRLGDYEYVNPAHRTLGYEPEELVGTSGFDVVHPDDRLMLVTELTQGGNKMDITDRAINYRALCRDGSLRYIRGRFSAIRDEAGKLDKVVLIAEDLTRQQWLEESLRESEHLLRVTQAVARIGGWSYEIATGKMAWTDETRRLHEVPDDFEPTIEQAANFYAPEAGPVISAAGEQCAREGVPFDLELPFVTARGRNLFVHTIGRAVFDGNRVAKVIGTFQDVTERVRAQEKLRQSEQQFRDAFQHSPIGMALCAPDLRFTRVNGAFCAMMGYSEEQLREMTFREITHADDIPRETEEVDQLLGGRRHTFSMEKRYVHRDGRVFWALTAVALMRDAEGRPLRFVVQVEDISARKQIDEERLKTQRLESIGVLAGGIAHDFNNILTGIMGNLSIARMEAERGQSTLESVTLAEQATVRARDLTRQLLTFSRGGKPVVRLESVPPIVEEAVGFVRHGANVRCDITFAPDLLPAVIDAGQISQVVHNLVINAIQAMPRGGNVLVGVENAELPPDNPLGLASGKYIVISVADQGQGIPPEIMPRIFDPYFTTKEKGSGLGLATSYSIVTRHEGRITVHSEPGKGTVFKVFLPAAEPVPAAAPADSSDLQTGAGRILVMDDEGSVLRVVQRMLTMLGYEAEVAVEGARAVQVYRQAREAGRPFDAVIFDLTVPGGMGGKEAVAAILEFDHTVKAIVASGYSDDPVMANFADYGFSGVMAKPYRIKDLSRLLHDLLTPKR